MKKMVVLSGAGMSAESGVSTFRGAGGLWDKYPVEEVATPQGYAANPGLVINFYNERRRQLLDVEPNKGHELIAELEKEFNVTVVTQNIDNLHERAGSSKVIHLHGELTKVCSSYAPNDPRYIKKLSPEEYEIKIGDLAPDGSQYRPYIVWFGEAVPKIEEAIQYVEQADIFLIIGTSMNVYPAAGLLNYVSSRIPVYLIDPNEVNVNSNGHKIHVIRKVASEGMEELMKLLSEKEKV
ncbi:NAD-dependent deacylase [uncultured Bacteroides sp.]|uniref:SIR2 family NAD-dependent protein deacylase n=1 Tax=uncultured Bacteroides sp. TaxID=162156 RepID=UPI002AAC0B0B|nr:NAD-dependent deacylase [uncultured Bacteroides sp.]